MAACNDDAVILTISETGYGRRSDVTDYRLQSRGGKGITNYKVEKYGDVAAVLTVTDDDDIIMISSDGVIIRIAVEGISKFNRPGKGVRVMKFGANSDAFVLSASTTPHDEDEVTDVADAPDADSAADADDVDEADEAEETAEE
jgi:DNA gyrase subunit A